MRVVARWVGGAVALACVVATSWSAAAPGERHEAGALGSTETAVPDHLPRTLRISLVHSGPPVATLQERIASWFPAATEVLVREQSDVDRAQMLGAPSEGEVRLWILKLSEQRAVVVFAVADAASTKHLVRDVELRSGLDELGLERLAFVVHSAVVALGEGSATTPREDVERLLDSEAVARLPTVGATSSDADTFASASGSFAAASGASAAAQTGPLPPVPPPSPPPSAVPPTTPGPELSAGRAPLPPAPPRPAASASADALPADAGTNTSRALPVALAAGYGVRFRGPEGTGHGPLAEVSATWQQSANVFAALAGGHLFLPSAFEAEGRDVGLEVVHLYLGAAWDRRLSVSWSSALSVGPGIDLVRVEPPPAEENSEGEAFAPRAEGNQQRPTAEASLGIWYANPVLAVGLFVQTIFVLNDVEYRIATESGERSVLSARRIQPGIALRLRFPGQG